MLTVPAVAEEPADEPKLVLVLSGGGARGFAHVGVLRVLEELHIAPDLIVGTSMGSIVGGLYAAGWSPDEPAAGLGPDAGRRIREVVHDLRPMGG